MGHSQWGAGPGTSALGPGLDPKTAIARLPGLPGLILNHVMVDNHA